jgi:hypothetical protein
MEEDEMDWVCSIHGEMRNSHNILVGNRWEDNIKMDVKEMGWEDVVLIQSGSG